MNFRILLLGIVSCPWVYAADSTVTVPWEEFDQLYKGQVEQSFKVIKEQPSPVTSLELVEYDVSIQGAQAIGTISVLGNVIAGEPHSIPLFDQGVVVTEIIETQNAALLTNQGSYYLQALGAGTFSLKFGVAIPLIDFWGAPRLELDVPAAVRNALKISTSNKLNILEQENLLKIGDRYFFPPTGSLNINFERVIASDSGFQTTENLLSQVETPETVLDSVTFFVSFAEDGTVLSALDLLLPAQENNQLKLDPIKDAEIWSLQVNNKPRSLYKSPTGKWVITLDSKGESRVVLAYLTRGQKLGLEGKLDFNLPETGLTARRVNLIVGLPERMQMLAMDSDLQPADGSNWPGFSSFNGRPHHFTKPFYRGRQFTSSIIYQEPVNP